MTAPTCTRCGRPTADGFACSPCALRLAESLRTAAGHAEDADAVLGRQTRYGSGSRGGSSGGLTPNPQLMAGYGAIALAIGGWASIVITESGRTPRWRPYFGPLCAPARPGDEDREGNRCDHDSCATARRRIQPSTLAVDAAWLGQARQVEFLRKHPAADEAFRELHDACDQLARLVDRPADKELVGMCDCGKVLYAPHGRTVVQCPVTTCRLVWNVERSREILRRHLGDKLFTAGEAARLAAHWDERSSDQIRKLINKWAERRLIETHGVDRDGDPTFRFGDVADRLARTPRRNREGAAA